MVDSVNASGPSGGSIGAQGTPDSSSNAAPAGGTPPSSLHSEPAGMAGGSFPPSALNSNPTSAERLASQPTAVAQLAAQNTTTADMASQPTTAEQLSGQAAPLSPVTIQGLGSIPSATGPLPTSPLRNLGENIRDVADPNQGLVSDEELRGWIGDAANYYGIPQAILATIVQHERAHNAPLSKKFGQWGEHHITTLGAILDKALWDIVPDSISGGSAGIANVTRPTLQAATSYFEKTYDRPVMPDNMRYRYTNGSGLLPPGFDPRTLPPAAAERFRSDMDTRISGMDIRADLHYGAAVVRQLIDQQTGPRYHGPLTLSQVENVFRRYNGSGPLADKYAREAMDLLVGAANGTRTLHYYAK